MAANPRKQPMIAGTPVEKPVLLRPGKVFALFELQRELDIESTGAVWLAEDIVEASSRSSCVKVFT